jgi:hypothetical protein
MKLSWHIPFPDSVHWKQEDFLRQMQASQHTSGTAKTTQMFPSATHVLPAPNRNLFTKFLILPRDHTKIGQSVHKELHCQSHQ